MIGSGYLRLAGFGPHWFSITVTWLFGLWMLWYLLASFRAVYAQGWRWTALKFVLLFLIHGFLLSLAAMLLALGTVAWLAFE